MTCIRTTCAAVALLALICAAWAQDFGYGGQHGPEHWGEDYKRCSGKHQSPINIDSVHVQDKSFPALEFTNFDVTPNATRLTNNGHTVLVNMTFEKGQEPFVCGGPLATTSRSCYQFEQFHFHWGENDTVGSEDLINNQAFPAELHVVLRNLEYKDFNSALGQDHGVAVMAFFFRKERANDEYEEFTMTLANISRKGQTVDMENPRTMRQFLVPDLINYYSYVGSLTTPPCSEEVVWIDFTWPIGITEEQLNRFRQLTSNDEHLLNNFRPTQPLNNRTVYRNHIDFQPQGCGHSIPFVNAANGAKGLANGIAIILACLGFAWALCKAKILVAFN